MRLPQLTVLAITGLTLIAPATAAAAPSPVPNPETVNTVAGAGEATCLLTDPRLGAVTGLAISDSSAYAVVSRAQPIHDVVYRLDPATCTVTGTPIRLTGTPRPVDPQDLAVGPDGSIWVGDIGDPATLSPHRSTVALWKISPNGGVSGPWLLSYSDGPHDAGTLLIGNDGTPVIVTRQTTAGSGIYVPDAWPPVQGTTAPLRRAGSVTLPATTTVHPLGNAAHVIITGGYRSSDRQRVGLRTLTDAIEWNIPDGRIADALQKPPVRITALPGETWGSAVTSSADGRLLTVSDLGAYPNHRQSVLRYQPAAIAAAAPTIASATTARPWWQWWTGSTRRLYTLLTLVGGIGMILVAAGLIQSRRFRRKSEIPADGDTMVLPLR